MDDINVILQQQIQDTISIQRELLDKIASGSVPDDSDKISIDICEKVIKNAISINRFNDVLTEYEDNEKYETYLKSLDNKDIKIY